MNDSATEPSNEGRPTAGRLVSAAKIAPAKYEPYHHVGAYGGAPPDPTSDLRLNILECWRILNKRKWLILSVLVASVAIGSLPKLMETPLYTATARLQIDRNVAKIIEGGNVTPVEGSDLEFQRTQYELLLSRTMAERVASSLKLGEDPDFLKPRKFSIWAAIKGLLKPSAPVSNQSMNKSALERWAAGIVMANRGVRPVSGSRLVDIVYSDPNPVRAQKIVMAYADVFIASNLDKRFEATSYAKTFLEDQLKQLKLRLEESEKTLLEFAQKEQIVAVTERSTIAENNLAAANATLEALASERIKNEQLWRQVDAADEINLPQLLTNGVIDGLRSKRNELVTEYQEKLETFKPGYPAMVQIKNKIAEIDRQLGAEVATIKSSFKAAYESSLNQEAEMTKRIESLRGEVLDLQKRSIEYNILKREVDTNRSIYEDLLQRYKEVDVAGGVGANNIFIIEKADVPGAPSSPRMSRTLMLSLGLGLGAGFAAAYLLERLDDRVRTPEEIERISGLANLGIIPKADDANNIEAEFADPRSPLSEAYRSLCTALQFSTESGLPKSLLITSSGPSEGKSITALAVARHFAAMGLKVLLVEADLRNPSLHVKLGLEMAPGLTNYLTGSCTPPEALQKTATPNLALMASGPLPPNAADLLGSPRFLSLLSVGLEVFDLIVIDGPPVMALADAPLVSSATAATAFVVGAGQGNASIIRGALKRLQFARGLVIGTVLTKFDAKSAGYGYGYSYSYGYSHKHAYGADNPTYGRQAGIENQSMPRSTGAETG